VTLAPLGFEKRFNWNLARISDGAIAKYLVAYEIVESAFTVAALANLKR
jgi:hypothetical protein